MSRGQIRDILSAGEVRRPSFSHIVQSGGSPVPTGGPGGALGDMAAGDGMDATFFWRLSKLGRIGSSKLRFDDDFVDRLNYQFTGILLFMFIGLIGIRQYVGKPIQCWIPQEFTRGWEEYTENYCWVSNTYFASIKERMPSKEVRQEQMIGYYQWAPILLGLQSLLFYIPCLVWRYANPHSGFNVRRILQVASEANCSLVPEQLQKSISFIARHMDMCLYRHRLCHHHRHRFSKQPGSLRHSTHQHQHHIKIGHNPSQHHLSSFPQRKFSSTKSVPETLMKKHSTGTSNPTSSFKHRPSTVSAKLPHLRPCLSKLQCICCCTGRYQGNFLSLLYLAVKLLYLANIIGQLYLMEKFIGTKYTFYGIRVLWDLIRGHEWHHSGNFPRVTFCDIEAKKLGKNHLYSLQCVLPMNMFLEKIYIFLWFWHVIIGLATLISFFVWLRRLASSTQRVRLIRTFLRLMNVLHETDRGPSRKFAENYLKSDGCFLIHLISGNIGDLVAGDLVCELWQIYRHKRIQEFDELKFPGAFNLESRLPPSLMLNNTSNFNNDFNEKPGTGTTLQSGSNNNNGNNNNQDEIV